MPASALPSSSPATAVECRRLTRRFSDLVAVDGIDLEVHAGHATALLGPNGAGKTTTLNMLMGLVHPTAGEARLFGIPSSDRASRRDVGFLPESPAFYGHLTGLDNLELLAGLSGGTAPDRAWALDVLGMSGADLARRVDGYSAGALQKLGLIQAVQHRPALVIMDEPTSQLDAVAREGFRALVGGIVEDGRTVMLASQALDEVHAICDSLSVLGGGRLLLSSATDQLVASAPRRLTVRYRVPPEAVPPGVVEPRLAGTVLSGKVPPESNALLHALTADPSVEDVLVESATLEDVLLGLYRSTPA